MVKFDKKRCEYCRFNRGKCELGLVSVRGDLCHEKECFLDVRRGKNENKLHSISRFFHRYYK